MAEQWFEKSNPTGLAAEVGIASDSSTLGRTSQAPEPTTGSGANRFVCSVWALAFVAALVLLWQYSDNVPGLEEWEMVPYVTGDQPVTLSEPGIAEVNAG
jgi:hypothetical protein